MGYRDDKSADEATTVKEVKQLYSIQFQGKVKKRKKKPKKVAGQKSIF
jgi:hypothetical protein